MINWLLRLFGYKVKMKTSGFEFSHNSLKNLKGVHPDLVSVMYNALDITTVDFAITEGLRTVERQKKLLEQGKSTTMNSRHLTGHAVDVMAYVGGKGSWDWDLYEVIAVAVKKAAKDLDVPIKWGGDWTTFKDGVHFELDRDFYK